MMGGDTRCSIEIDMIVAVWLREKQKWALVVKEKEARGAWEIVMLSTIIQLFFLTHPIIELDLINTVSP